LVIKNYFFIIFKYLETINQKGEASFRGTLRQENLEPNACHEEREESQNHLTPDGYCGSHYLQTTD
jgi:hypothetical protein